MNSHDTRTAVMQSAQTLFEQSGFTRLPALDEVRTHGDYSMKDTAAAMGDWLETQNLLQDTPDPGVTGNDPSLASPLLRQLVDAIEGIALRAVEKASANAARCATVRRWVRDSLAQTCDAQRGELHAQGDRLTAAESKVIQIQTTAAADERNAARRETELRQAIGEEKTRTGLAENRIKVLERTAQSLESDLADARNIIKSQLKREAVASTEQNSLQAQIESYRGCIDTLTNSLAGLLDVGESMNSLCHQAAGLHELSDVVRVQLAALTPPLKSSLARIDQPQGIEKRRPSKARLEPPLSEQAHRISKQAAAKEGNAHVDDTRVPN